MLKEFFMKCKEACHKAKLLYSDWSVFPCLEKTAIFWTKDYILSRSRKGMAKPSMQRPFP